MADKKWNVQFYFQPQPFYLAPPPLSPQIISMQAISVDVRLCSLLVPESHFSQRYTIFLGTEKR